MFNIYRRFICIFRHPPWNTILHSNLRMKQEISTNDSSNQTKAKSEAPKAGLWSVLFLTIGIQFAGMTSGWNGASREGLGNCLLTNLFVGTMYLLLSMCYAELTSVVAFAGGSFGYCRAALGPFWGFLVGASEMLENFLYVVVTVMTIGSACTEVFGTSRQWEPVWYLLTYGFLVGVHLRGGELLWYTVIVCGVVTFLLVLLYCCREMESINMFKYGLPDNRVFPRSPHHFMEALFYPTWFYIGVEILPQTCNRVENANMTLPRGMVWGDLLAFLVSFWMIFASTCNFPGLTDDFATTLFPLQHGYQHAMHTPHNVGAFVTLIPSLSAAIGFMWGCGYQVMALARSGLLPAVCMKTFGSNETPYVNLCVSALLQFVVCVWMWAMAPTEGPSVLYETVVIGASMVYMGVFGSFIVFRYRFGAMKREWVSVAGVPGALVGMFIAMLLFISAVGFQQSGNATVIYFVFMTLAGVYYLWYAQRTQYFSAEEQKKFMKAYILNANRRNRRKAKSSSDRVSASWFVPVSRMFGLSITGGKSRENSSLHSVSSMGSKSAGINGRSRTEMSMLSAGMKLNAVAPAEDISAPAEDLFRNDGDQRQLPSSPALPDLECGAQESDKADESRPEIPVSLRLNIDALPKNSTSESYPSSPTSLQRRNMAGSLRVGWSGKIMSMDESKKFFELITSVKKNHVAEKLFVALPGQFEILPVNGSVEEAEEGASLTDEGVGFEVRTEVLQKLGHPVMAT